MNQIARADGPVHIVKSARMIDRNAVDKRETIMSRIKAIFTGNDPAGLRTVLTYTIRVSLVVSGLSLAYLLFMFGHTETAPLNRILTACAIAATGALVGGVLQWVGLPAEPKAAGAKKSKVPSTTARGK